MNQEQASGAQAREGRIRETDQQANNRQYNFVRTEDLDPNVTEITELKS